MLVDNISLYIKAGNGGAGKVSFLRNGQKQKGGPDGGNGGNGGNIYFQGSSNINDLKEFRFKKKIMALEGISGKQNNLYGKNAPHTTVLLPLGTQITDQESGKIIEINNTDLVLIAQGGKGGRGNNEFKSATNQAPKFAESGGAGEEKNLLLELKLIAQIGLIGLPNAGKSSLLAVLTNADPKIGNYPFTTLEPNIGVMEKITIADIPGLIEGASRGKGLGIQFLRHIEKTKLLVHCIDSQNENAGKAYRTVHDEFAQYNANLLEKKEIIVLTKSDLVSEKILKKNLALFQKMKREVLTFSIYNPEDVDKLKQTLKNFL